ncbi:MAG TPA: ABC transporter permease [Terriglobales bacterium]|nr:ABC transporter permease [Terriglobales bacterium]
MKSGAITARIPSFGIGHGWLRYASLLVLVLGWQLAASLVGDKSLLPGPVETATVAIAQIQSGDLLFHVGMTLLRVCLAFAAAMLVGTAIGIALGRSEELDQFFDSWLVIALNIPALVTIVLCYVWFGLTDTAAILAVALNKIPTVVTILREGAKALDEALLEMSRLYRVPPQRILWRIVLPQLAPSLMAAARSGLALTWKIVLVVELLGRPNGVGFEIRRFFNFFDLAGILAYTLVFVAIILLIEAALLKPLDRRVSRWRRL